MQGPRFTVAHIGEHIFLLASNGNVVYTAELTLESVVVTNELADDETVAPVSYTHLTLPTTPYV